MTTATANAHGDRDFLGHPRGLYVCFGTELWERFSFYGMKYLLLLYLTKYHLFSDEAGLGVLGSYAALVYAMPVLGGLIADRYLGVRRSVVFGGILLVLGHLGMAYEGKAATLTASGVSRDDGAIQVFYLSLAFIIMGVGYLKPNISTIVGKLYSDDDPRRDSGFTIFYMGINIGAFSAALLCGWLGEVYGWGYGFGAAGIGMVLGLLLFLWGQPLLEGHGEAPDSALLKKPLGPVSLETAIYLLSLLGIAVVWQLVQFNALVGSLLNVVSLLLLGGLIWYLYRYCTKVERERMLVMIILIVMSVVFWALFEQSAGSMTLFADRLTDLTLFGVKFTASQFGAANSLFIFTVAPIMAFLWVWLARRGLEPNTPMKFALGIAFAGFGFGAISYGAGFQDAAGLVSAWWLIIAILLHTIGELCLSPVGLSAVTKLSVPGVVGVMMGTWFLASAYASYMASVLGSLATTPDVSAAAEGASELANYVGLYDQLFLYGAGAGAILLILTPLLKRMMHGIH